MAETVETAIYRLQVEGQAKLGELKSHIDGLAVSSENATNANRKFSQGLQTSIARGDETVRALENMRKAMVSFEGYAEEGKGTQQQLAAYYEITNQKIAVQTKKLEDLAAAQANANRMAKSTDYGTQFGPATGQFQQFAQYKAEDARAFGDQLTARLVPEVKKSAHISGKVFVDAFEDEMNQLAKIAQLKAEQAGQNFQRSLNEHFRVGAAPGKSARESFAAFEEAGMIPGAVKHMDQLGNSTKVARYEMINLGRQANDVIVSLASGQGILTVGLQQGSQILDVFTSSERTAGEMFKQIGTSIAGFVTNPLVLAGAAVTALVTTTLALANAWDKVQVSSQRAISGAGQRTGTSVEDLNRFVSQNARTGSATGLSEVEARKLATEFTKTGDIVVSQLGRMDNAVVGFANQAGQSVDEAIKAWVKFGTDPVKAMDELEKTFGAIDGKTRDLVERFVTAGDKTSALAALVAGLSDKTKEAAQNMGFLESLWRRVTTLAGKEIATPAGLGDQMKAAQDRLATMEATPRGGSGYGQIGPRPEDIRAAREEVARLNAEMEKESAKVYAAQLAYVADQARKVTEATIPQIEQIRKLDGELIKLREAEARGVGGADNRAAIAAKEVLLQKTRDTKEETERLNARVKEIAGSWGNVSQSVALQLQTLQNNLPVAEAVGGAAKMAAQYTADYKNYMDQSKTATEATALAAANLKQSMAQVNAQAKETLFSLQNQAQVAGAVTGAEKIAAQQRATYNQLVHEGVKEETAYAVARQQASNAQAQATASVEQQVEALKDSNRMIIAQQNGTEATTAAAIAYKNAIKSGADSTAAAALSAETLKNHLLQSGQYVRSMAEYAQDMIAGLNAFQSGGAQSLASAMTYANPNAQATPQDLSHSAFETAIMPRGSLTYAADPRYPVSYGRGTGKRMDVGYGSVGNLMLAAGEATIDPLTGMLVAKQETAATDLKNSIDDLKTSTDDLRKSNEDLLSPYYTQDPRTSHIGFRSQGMASGGYVDVPGGYSANDNMMAMIPVASGERIHVDPMTSKRGGAGGMVINISSPINIFGNADKDQFGRTVYQNNQQLAKQVRAATQ